MWLSGSRNPEIAGLRNTGDEKHRIVRVSKFRHRVASGSRNLGIAKYRNPETQQRRGIWPPKHRAPETLNPRNIEVEKARNLEVSEITGTEYLNPDATWGRNRDIWNRREYRNTSTHKCRHLESQKCRNLTGHRNHFFFFISSKMQYSLRLKSSSVC